MGEKKVKEDWNVFIWIESLGGHWQTHKDFASGGRDHRTDDYSKLERIPGEEAEDYI